MTCTVTSPVRVVARKWPDRAHWEHDALRLGEDDHGVWLGAPPGTYLSRPGAAFHSDQAHVTLVPRDGAFVATFYGRGGSAHCDVYVDITTVPVWDGDTVTAVDLDLDVVRGWTGRVWVDGGDGVAVPHRDGRDVDVHVAVRGPAAAVEGRHESALARHEGHLRLVAVEGRPGSAHVGAERGAQPDAVVVLAQPECVVLPVRSVGPLAGHHTDRRPTSGRHGAVHRATGRLQSCHPSEPAAQLNQ